MIRNNILRCSLATLLLFVATASCVMAAALPTKQQADSAYAKKNYREATTLYEAVLKGGVSATVYYNLGNAYYRLNDLPKAVLNYERALKYEPAFSDARYNLDVCRSKMSVPRDNATGMFFVLWFNRLVHSHSADFWGWLGIAALVCALIGWGGNRFIPSHIGRKLMQIASYACLLLLCFSLAAAAIQRHRFQNERRAVVMTDTTLRADSGKNTKQMLMAGTTVVILDESPDGQLLVERQDKSLRGWVSGKALSHI